MKTPIKKSHIDPETEFGDRHRVRRFKQVAEHYPSRMGLFRRVYHGQASPREAIKAFCLECNGWEEAAIRDCPSTACPIWRERPFQVRAGGSATCHQA